MSWRGWLWLGLGLWVLGPITLVWLYVEFDTRRRRRRLERRRDRRGGYVAERRPW